MKINYIGMILAFLLCLPAAATYGEEQYKPLDVTRWYKVYWLNGYVGDVIVQVKEEKNGTFHIKSHVKAQGIAKQFSKYWSETKSVTGFDGTEFIPDFFYSESRLRKKLRNTTLKYAPDGALRKETVNPPENPEKRPVVETAIKRYSVDPHTAILIARKKILEGLKTGKANFSIPLYEGKRRSDLMFTIHRKEVLELNRREIRVIHVSFRRHAIAGFTKKELKRMKKEEPVIDLYLQDNQLLLPVKARARAKIGEAIAVLEQECYSVDTCRDTPRSYIANKVISNKNF